MMQELNTISHEIMLMFTSVLPYNYQKKKPKLNIVFFFRAGAK